MAAAERQCEVLNLAFGHSGEASSICSLHPAAHGAFYTEEDLQRMVDNGTLAEPPQIRSANTMVDKVLP